MSDTQELIDELHQERVERYQPLSREGNYGLHLTYTGKICYQRKRHWFTRRDWERIGKKFLVTSVEEGDAEQPQAFWWMEVLKKYTIDMMKEIFDVPQLRALQLDAESIYQQVQTWSSEIGLQYADSLDRQGHYDTAAMVRELFILRAWKNP